MAEENPVLAQENARKENPNFTRTFGDLIAEFKTHEHITTGLANVICQILGQIDLLQKQVAHLQQATVNLHGRVLQQEQQKSPSDTPIETVATINTDDAGTSGNPTDTNAAS